MPENWVQHPVINTEAGSNPGAPLAWGSPENPDDVVAGYGYVAADTSDVEETFYYHSDHLGSTSYITDQKANVTQYDAYLPYGELLVDEHSSSAEMPYKFNGKELDEETGLYYYGARYMNPITSMWYGVDPLAEKYPNVSAFVYCMGNPVKLFDPDGKKILFVNGHWTPGLSGEWLGSRYPGRKYWSNGFAQAAQQYFDDYSQITDNNYIDGSSTCGFDMSGQDRYEKGYEYAKANINELTKNMSKDEPFYMVTHSEGAAYGAGIAQYLLDNGYNVKKVLHLSADEGDEFTTPAKPLTIQLAYDGDWVTGNKRIGNTDKFGLLDSEHLGWRFKHGTTKGSSIFKYAKELEKAVLLHWQGEVDGKFSDWYSVKQGTSNAKFVNINGYRIKQQNEK